MATNLLFSVVRKILTTFLQVPCSPDEFTTFYSPSLFRHFTEDCPTGLLFLLSLLAFFSKRLPFSRAVRAVYEISGVEKRGGERKVKVRGKAEKDLEQKAAALDH